CLSCFVDLFLRYFFFFFFLLFFVFFFFFFFQAEDGIRDRNVTGVQTCLFRSRYNHAKYCDSRRLSRLRSILGCVVGKFFRLAEGESEIIPSVEKLSSIVERVSRALWHFCQPLSCAGTCESHR